MGNLVRVDPDDQALERASDHIGALLTEFGVQTTRTQRRALVNEAVLSWLRNRFVEWSKDRSISGVGSPDAYTLGLAEAVLPIVAEVQVPWSKPVGDWSKDEISVLLATAFDAMEEQRARTMEDPTAQWTEVVNA
jgi:hypothetical protein